MNHSLDFKLGQMLMVGFRGATSEECAPFLQQIQRFHVGSVWLTDAESPMGRVPGNIRSPQQLQTLTRCLQETAGASRMPLIIAIDGEGGEVIRLKPEFGFPAFRAPQQLAEKQDLELTRSEAGRLAALLREMGINLNLAPVVDVHRNPENPVIGRRGRAFSTDALEVTRQAVAFIEAHHALGVRCALKHFPGHGSSSTDSHLSMVDVTQTWSDEELLPYRELVARGLADAVLSAHVFIRTIDPAFPATLSPAIMTGLLRNEIGFQGVILSDDMNMRAISQHFSPDDALERALHAGVDVIVHGNVADYDERIVERTLQRLRQLVDSGRISEARIDASFQRIVALKRRLNG